MSDITTAVPEPITTLIDGKTYELKRLSVYDRVELLREYRKAARSLLAETLKSAGVDAGETVATLNDFDREPLTEKTWIDYVNDPMNDHLIMERALRKSAGDKSGELAKEVQPSLELKAKLCGLGVFSPPDEGQGGGTNPQNQPAYGK